MRKPVLSALLAGGRGAWRVLKTTEPPRERGLRRFMSFVVLPVWLAAGTMDYLWHRWTRIETTAGMKESLMHLLMASEAFPGVVAGLFLEINSGAIALILASFISHQLTAIWDVTFTVSRRTIPAGEQHTHTFLEAVPFCVASLAIATHWDQFLAIFGKGRGKADYAIRLRKPPVSGLYLMAVFGAIFLFNALPHFEELWRCRQAQKAGLTGRGDTPECARELFGESPVRHL